MDDTGFVTDRIADAGKLLDQDLAYAEPTAQASAHVWKASPRASRWWQAAAHLAPSRAAEAAALTQHATSCMNGGDYRGAARSALDVVDRLLDTMTTAGARQMVVGTLLHVLHCTGNLDVLRDIAEGKEPLPGDVTARLTWTGMALFWTGRWPEARPLLDRARRPEYENSSDTYAADLFCMAIDVSRGDTAGFEACRDDPSRWALDAVPALRFAFVVSMIEISIYLGDIERARGIRRSRDVRMEDLPLTVRASVAFADGRYDEAADLTRRACVLTLSAEDLSGLVMRQHYAYLLIARGQIVAARTFIEETGSRYSPIAFLLAGPAAAVDRVLGDRSAAYDRIGDAVTQSEDHGCVVGMEYVLMEQALAALADADDVAARSAAAAMDKLHSTVGSSRTALFSLLVRACVQHDQAAAVRSVAVARERSLSHEIAATLYVLGHEDLLGHAELDELYTRYGQMDGLLYRHRIRTMMTRAGLSIPDRAGVTAENERLLSTLVGEGLGNRSIAMVLGVTEKSVEGRLGRVFARLGIGSRTELVTVVQRGGLG
ncbi:helix-turn-helix transcriptional regulator [Pseudonocardia sp. ICBG1122]|nr:helix-turn-helix transcriptional regulator [Pseudonocardia pini]